MSHSVHLPHFADSEEAEGSRIPTVREYMIAHGPPTIAVLNLENGTYYALEGSNRLTVAHQLKCRPKFIVFGEEHGDELVSRYMDYGVLACERELIGDLLAKAEEDMHDPLSERRPVLAFEEVDLLPPDPAQRINLAP